MIIVKVCVNIAKESVFKCSVKARVGTWPGMSEKNAMTHSQSQFTSKF
jgi:hypothetical protein